MAFLSDQALKGLKLLMSVRGLWEPIGCFRNACAGSTTAILQHSTQKRECSRCSVSPSDVS